MGYEFIVSNFFDLLQKERANVKLLLFYSLLETILLLVMPFASSFIINSLLAHAVLSLLVISVIVSILLLVVVFVQLTKEYIIEKYQQSIFVDTSIDVANLSLDACDNTKQMNRSRYMNYCFEVLTLQKITPMLVLDGAALFMKTIVSLLLLLAFDPWLFIGGVVLLSLYVVVLMRLGKDGFKYAVERSDAKHEALFHLQHLCESSDLKQSQTHLDELLHQFIAKRQQMFSVLFRQFAWSFLTEALLFSGFFILGGLLVINGTLPIGEFVAAEILVISLIYAIHSFIKQLDYIYDMAEGIYKINKLSNKLEEAS